MIRTGRCVNFGNCTQADSKTKLKVPQGVDFVCPECSRALQPVAETFHGPNWQLVAAVFAGVIVIVGCYYWYKHRSTDGLTGGLLGRPLHVGVVTWPGYAGGIVANGGFNANKE